MLGPREPTSESMSARPHGRFVAAADALTLFLVLCTSQIERLGGGVFVAVVLLFALASLWLYLWNLPFYSIAGNQMHVFAAIMVLWAAVCMAMAQLRVGSSGAVR